METITLNAKDYPPQGYTVFFDRAEAKREFPGIKLAVQSPYPNTNDRKASMKSLSKTSLLLSLKNTWGNHM